MREIEQAQQAIEQAKQNLTEAVRQARTEGHTWAAIGKTLGMSRQAAFKRFGEVLNPVTGTTIEGAHMSLAHITQATEQVFTLISEGKYTELEQLMHPEVKTELPASVIADTWNQVLTEVGALESFTDTHVALPAGERIEEDAQVLGTVVGVTMIHCEAGELMGRVAFDQDQRIVGLLMVEPNHSPLPF